MNGNDIKFTWIRSALTRLHIFNIQHGFEPDISLSEFHMQSNYLRGSISEESSNTSIQIHYADLAACPSPLLHFGYKRLPSISKWWIYWIKLQQGTVQIGIFSRKFSASGAQLEWEYLDPSYLLEFNALSLDPEFLEGY